METLQEYIDRHQSNKEKSSELTTYLSELIDKHGFKKDSEIYNKVGVSRQTWSNIMSGKNKPELKTLIRIVFALELNTHECKYLLKKVGYTLSASSEVALILRYHIENKIYDLDKLNESLMEYGYSDWVIY